MSLAEIRSNPVRLTDAYNISHFVLKCDSGYEVSHFYNRKEGMILFGFHETSHSVLGTQITEDMVTAVYRESLEAGFQHMFPYDMWMRVVNECNGYMPLMIECVPEGTWCPAGTPFAQIRNTKSGFGELVTWIEAVLMHSYFASACATEAFHMLNYLKENNLPLTKFHSFGFRGHRSLEDAYWAGMAWSMFLPGTDDFHVLGHGAKGGSIPALAHKVTQQYDDEMECFLHTIDATANYGLSTAALVIDTYDADRVIDEYIHILAPYAKERNVHIVKRPDSGDVFDQAVRIWHICNDYGYDNVSVIIGEGMSFQQAKRYDAKLKELGIPLEFVSYGIGGGFYKHIDRDTLGWAMKTAYSNGADRMKFSMSPLKRSIPGHVKLGYSVEHDGQLTVFAGEECPGGFTLSFDSHYDTIYYFDPEVEGMVEPQFDLSQYRDTVLRAHDQLANIKQEHIVLTKAVYAKIESFRERYLGGKH